MLGPMFAMLIFRATAAFAALQIFLLVVVWPDAGLVVALLVGLVNAAAILAVGRVVLRDAQAPPAVELPFRPGFYLIVVAISALLVQFWLGSLFPGSGGGLGTATIVTNGLGMLLALYLLVSNALNLNKFSGSGDAPP